jgi:uncharacterized Zn finger protein
MEMSRKRWTQALEWVDKGVALGAVREWHNESCGSLEDLKPEILRKLGRKEDAQALVWAEFERSPCEFSYEELMRHAPKGERSAWHERAMAAASHAALEDFMSLCVKAKDWSRLATRIHAATHAELERVSHFDSEPAAKALSKRDPLAAAKVFRALGVRILADGKSKYYGEALDSFERARDLYCAHGRASEWQELVQSVRVEQSRKRGFLSAFEKTVAGQSGSEPSFAEQARQRWKQQTS